MRRLFVFVALLAMTSVASAAPPDEPDCKDPVTQLDMNLCAQADLDEADEELNAAWKDARSHAREIDADQPDASMRGAEKALQAAQRGWIAFRDGECELAGFEARGGSMEPMLVAGCKATMTRARTVELRRFVTGEE